MTKWVVILFNYSKYLYVSTTPNFNCYHRLLIRNIFTWPRIQVKNLMALWFWRKQRQIGDRQSSCQKYALLFKNWEFLNFFFFNCLRSSYSVCKFYYWFEYAPMSQLSDVKPKVNYIGLKFAALIRLFWVKD